MKKIIKSLSYVLIMIVIATMVSGCSSKQTGSESSKKFIIWSFEDEDIWKPTIEQIQKNLSGYEVKYVKKKLDSSYESDSLNSIMSGQGPDLWSIPSDWVYRHKDKLEPLPDELSKDFDVEKKFVPAIKQSSVFDGKLYSLTPYMDTIMAYYNPAILNETLDSYLNSHQLSSDMGDSEMDAAQKENNRISKLFESFPSTWNDLTEVSKMVTKRSGSTINLSGIALGTSGNIQESEDILYAMMMQNGTKMTSDDLKLATFSLPEESSNSKENTPAKRAVDFYTSFSNPLSPNYSWNNSMPKDIEAFAQGKVAIILGYGQFEGYLSQNYPSFQYRKAPLPQIGDNETNVTDYAKFRTFVVPKLSSSTVGAWRTILSISSGDFEISRPAGVASPIPQSNTSASLSSRQNISDPGEVQALSAKTWTKGRYPQEMDKIFRDVIDKAVTDPSNIQSYLDNAAISATNFLKKTEW